MKTIREKFKEIHSPNVEKLFKGRSVGIMSAERSSLSPEENAERSDILHMHLQALGHKVYPVHGAYIENYGKPDAKPTYERSYMVAHKDTGDDKGLLLGHLKRLGSMFGQDSILHKPHDSETASLHGTNETGFPGKDKSLSVGTLKMGEKGEFHTRLKNGKTFAFRD